MNIAVVNTKGGVGKTSVALHMLPTLLIDKFETVNYYHLDDNNQVQYNTTNINIKQFKTDEANEVIDEAELNEFINEKNLNIIDAGGGNDTKKAIHTLKNSELENIKFIIPVDQNLLSRKNLIDTVNLIKDSFEKPEIYIVLSKLFDRQNFSKEFISIYGNEIFDIKPIPQYILKNFKQIGILPFSNLLQIFDANGKLLIDKFLDIKDLVENKKAFIKEYSQKLANLQGEENEAAKKEYFNFKERLRQAENIYNLVQELKKINSDFVNKMLKG